MDIGLIRKKLARMAELDTGSVVKEIHGYQLNPPLTEDALVEVEAANGFTVPEQYRRFLLNAGNGGAGPYGGILSLEESLGRWKYTLKTDELKPVLSGECPLEADVKARDVLPFDVDNHEALIDDEASGYYQKLQDAMVQTARRLQRGTLAICDYGGGDSFFLVLKGPRIGEVWGDNMDNYGGLFSLEVDFDRWYENWLNRTVATFEKKARPAGEVRYFEYADFEVGRSKDLSGP